MFSCPACGQPFASLEGVAMHYINKEDDAHDRLDEKWRVKQEANNAAEREAATDGSGEYDLPEFDPTDEPDQSDQSPAPDCCANPSLVGEAGDVYRIDDDTGVRLEAGEQICANCQEVHTDR